MLVSKCWRDSGHSSIVLAERVFWKSSPQPGLGYGTALTTNTSKRKCSSPTTLLARLLGANGGLVSGESGDRQDTPHTETDRISRGSVSQGIHLSRGETVPTGHQRRPSFSLLPFHLPLLLNLAWGLVLLVSFSSFFVQVHSLVHLRIHFQ